MRRRFLFLCSLILILSGSLLMGVTIMNHPLKEMNSSYNANVPKGYRTPSEYINPDTRTSGIIFVGIVFVGVGLVLSCFAFSPQMNSILAPFCLLIFGIILSSRYVIKYVATYIDSSHIFPLYYFREWRDYGLWLISLGIIILPVCVVLVFHIRKGYLYNMPHAITIDSHSSELTSGIVRYLAIALLAGCIFGLCLTASIAVCLLGLLPSLPAISISTMINNHEPITDHSLELWKIAPYNMIVYGLIGILFGYLFYRYRSSSGHCHNCGYILQGLTKPRCPECGTEFDPKLLKKLPGAQGTK